MLRGAIASLINPKEEGKKTVGEITFARHASYVICVPPGVPVYNVLKKYIVRNAVHLLDGNVLHVKYYPPPAQIQVRTLTYEVGKDVNCFFFTHFLLEKCALIFAPTTSHFLWSSKFSTNF